MSVCMIAKAQFPHPLPLSGKISLDQIADWMLSAGEITMSERSSALSINFLNHKSHLVNKTAPFSLSDWYGYSFATVQRVSSQKTNRFIVKEIESPHLQLYPNPTSGLIKLKAENLKGVFDLSIYNLKGNLILSNRNTNDSDYWEIDLSDKNLATSVYLIIITNIETGVSSTSKFLFLNK